MDEMLSSVRDFLNSFCKDNCSKEDLEKILRAMREVDRRYFVDYKELAYADQALGVGEGQTISQPSTVARMLQLCELRRGVRLLEVGTASGWSACVAARLVEPAKVVSIERIASLFRKAKKNISTFEKASGIRFKNLELRKGNLFSAKLEICDRVIITAGIVTEQEPLMWSFADRHLLEGGVMVCPHRVGPLIVIKKNKHLKVRYTKEHYSFVPLVQ